jgi:stage V sporulation protein D (sporulation-specific penicillin-binding protein)
VTGIQLIRGLSVIANGGLLVSPHIVQPTETQAARREAVPFPRVVDASACDAMRGMMAGVISTKGTGFNAIIPGLTLAGKTGTAQKAIAGQGYVEGKYTSLFACFVPGDKPEVVFLVVLDEATPYGGGATAAPVFHDVMLRWKNTGHFVPPSER